MQYIRDRLLTIPQHQRSWIADGFLHTPLTGITTQHFNGTVYNFEVADQHSYTTDSLLVHNRGSTWIYIKVENDDDRREVQDLAAGGHRHQ